MFNDIFKQNWANVFAFDQDNQFGIKPQPDIFCLIVPKMPLLMAKHYFYLTNSLFFCIILKIHSLHNLGSSYCIHVYHIYLAQ